MNKFFIAFILVLSGFFISDNVFASAVITSAKLNGLNDITVEGVTPITVTLNVNLTNQSVWKSTAYRFGGGAWTCINTPDHTIGTDITETFSIITPAKKGISKVYFEIYDNDNCAKNYISSVIMSPAGLLGSFMNIISFGTYSMWTVCLLTMLILFIILLVSLLCYFFKKKK